MIKFVIMKSFLILTFLFLGIENVISQNQQRVDSLLKERANLISQNKLTTQLDRELIKLSYSPKVVLTKAGNAYTFNYYLAINEQAIDRFKERLMGSFKVTEVIIDPLASTCTVTFKAEATEADRVTFYTAFGYEGIIYK